MSDKLTIHATLIEICGCGVLIEGNSNSGKSDLALRLIDRLQANLVADDVVVISKKNNQLYGQAPENLKGLLEVRFVGIIEIPYKKEHKIDMIVQLSDDINALERMPKICSKNILGLEIVQIALYAKENSAPEKVLTALKLLVLKTVKFKEKSYA